MKDKVQTITFWGLCFFLVCYFLRIFNFPNGLIVILGVGLCVTILLQTKRIKIDLGLCLLTFTMITYYGIVYGKRGLTFSILYIPLIIYILAIYLTDYTEDDDTKFMVLVYTLIIGHSLHGILNSGLYFAGYRVPGERRWLDIWTREWMLGTHQAVFFLPVLACFLPALFFFKKRKWVHAVVILTSMFFVYTSLATRSRTPILVLAIVFFVQIILYMIFEKDSLKEKLSDKRVWIFIVCLIIVLVITFLFIKDTQVVTTFINGLGKGGGIVNNVRFTAQRKALEQLFMYPMGGRQMDLGRTFCHNTWLDMANASGLIPFFGLVAYTLFTIIELISYLIKQEVSTEKKMIITGIYVAFFMFFTVEPALDASIHYFTPWIFINGIVHGELCRIKKTGGYYAK